MKRREEGSIEERVQGRKYLIRWSVKDESGKSRRMNQIVNGDYVEAQAELARRLRPADGEAIKPERTFASYCDNEWVQYTSNRWKWTTQITAGAYVRRYIRPFFDNMLLSKITPSDVVRFHQTLEAKGLSSKTRRNIHAILSTMFTHAAETLELITKSPIKKGIAPKVERHEKPSLTPEQAWQLWDELAGTETIRFRAFYGILLFTGIRTSEGLGLKWADVDFANQQITIRQAISRGKATTPKTEASLRPRPISPELHIALLHHRAMAIHTQPTDYVFASSSGRPANPDQLRGALQKVLRQKMQIHLGKREDGLHLLRHTSGSMVYRATCNVKEAQTWLGHSSSRITMDVYAHLMKQSQHDTATAAFARPALPAVAPAQQN